MKLTYAFVIIVIFKYKLVLLKRNQTFLNWTWTWNPLPITKCNNACFSFCWFVVKSHLMLIACVLCYQISSGRYTTKEQEDILEKSDSNVV